MASCIISSPPATSKIFTRNFRIESEQVTLSVQATPHMLFYNHGSIDSPYFQMSFLSIRKQSISLGPNGKIMIDRVVGSQL